mmetsp:Transcript_8446/g.13366  ORF Transcript_8446/g.13366 Transcript_8446/m.13366 type:complete len:91 (-) Transcript_8446:158-430(-)
MQAGINRISGWLPHGFLDNGILLSLRLQNNSISGSLPSQVINALPPFEPFIIYRTRDRNNDPPGGREYSRAPPFLLLHSFCPGHRQTTAQ